MKKLYFLILLSNYSVCFAQNLISNGGFEIYTSLPYKNAQFGNAVGWNNCYGQGTPDYFHIDGSLVAKLPDCLAGHVFPHSGSAIMGLVIWSNTLANYREYISCALSSELNIGNTYEVSFFFTNGVPTAIGGIGANNLAIAFSTTQLYQAGLSNILNVTPQYVSEGILYNTEWQKISFKFKADQAYKFITIGNFSNDKDTKKQVFTSGPASYFFIDDISIVDTFKKCDNVILNIFPNPVSEILHFDVNCDESFELTMFDAIGKKIFNSNFTKSTEWPTFNSANGIYFFEVKNKKGIIKKGKVVKY